MAAKRGDQALEALAGLPLSALQSVYTEIDARVREVLGDRLRNVLIGAGQADLLDALAADLLDALPLVGEISNALRVQDAALKGEQYRRRVLPPQLLDMALGWLPPPVGPILNAITPTNTLIYLSRLGR